MKMRMPTKKVTKITQMFIVTLKIEMLQEKSDRSEK